LKRPSTEWEKVFASYTYGKGLITRTQGAPKNILPQKISDPMKKWANKLNRTFSKEVQMAKKTHEEMFTIPGHRRNAKPY
jgi:hypothetical protein